MNWNKCLRLFVALMGALVVALFANMAMAAPTLKMNSHGHEVLLLQQKQKH